MLLSHILQIMDHLHMADDAPYIGFNLHLGIVKFRICKKGS